MFSLLREEPAIGLDRPLPQGSRVEALRQISARGTNVDDYDRGTIIEVTPPILMRLDLDEARQIVWVGLGIAPVLPAISCQEIPQGLESGGHDPFGIGRPSGPSVVVERDLGRRIVSS